MTAGCRSLNTECCWVTDSVVCCRSSPLSLIQEDYPDPWQHIICCVLCSRTSGSARIRSTIAAFFSTFPTPTTVLEADVADITAVIHPLGLQPTRLAAVKAVSHDFLATDWQEPSQFKGCGKFVADSWKVFCKGHRVSRGALTTWYVVCTPSASPCI
eukprot:GHUV01031336.1.p1 GENE.GHUV01031336.1~~GHUV01031336.1.p1  ORF type:complete len:157 (+),score=19.82 GHUV01031336.1:396-866(+)